MRIYQTPNFNINNNLPQKQLDKKCKTENFKNCEPINPIAYRPVSFTARLFRSPENFYEQDFNMKGMPDTMKNYLMDDFSDRRHMPPSDMMKLVFGDLNCAKTLDEVKKLYPDEPLFKDLKEPSSKVRTNIIGGLQVLQEGENIEALFKNGDNNLGLYILKKIYIEGKTLKEINTDFQKEAVGIYTELLPEIDYATLKHYGISYPNQSFWHSFYSNRDNFPYSYVPRKDYIRNGQVVHAGNNGNIVTKESETKRKFKILEKDLENISKSIINEQGNLHNTKKALRNIDRETSNFLFQYLSQIMSVATDRINLSERMEEFYATKGYSEIPQTQFLEMSKKQGALMKEFWKLNPVLKDHFSNAIKDTIELFTEEYGENGANQRFKELLEFAENIKPKRQELKSQHLAKQKYYEELFNELDKIKQGQENIEEIADIMNKAISLDEVSVDINDFNRKFIKFNYAPYKFTDFLFNYSKTHPKTIEMNEIFIKYGRDKEKLFEELTDYYSTIFSDYAFEKPRQYFASKFAIYETLNLSQYGFDLKSVFNMNPNSLDAEIGKIFQENPLTPLQRKEINEKYDTFLKDKLTPQETEKFAKLFIDDIFAINYPQYNAFAQQSKEVRATLEKIKFDSMAKIQNIVGFKDLCFITRAAYSKNGKYELREFLCEMIKSSIKIVK